MGKIRVIGVDPGMTGAAVECWHEDDGAVRIGTIWAWEQPHKTGAKGQATKSARPMKDDGLTEATRQAGMVVHDQRVASVFQRTYRLSVRSLLDPPQNEPYQPPPTIVRIEEAWHGTRSRAAIVSAAMTAAPWLLLANPLDNYEFLTPDEWRKHYGWSGNKRNLAKQLAQIWCLAKFIEHGVEHVVTEHVAEALALAYMPIPEGE